MIKILLKSYNLDLLNLYSYLFQKNSKSINFSFKLPIKKRKITLLKSPHVYKKAKTHYQESVYSVVICINKDLYNQFLFKRLITDIPQSIFVKVIHF